MTYDPGALWRTFWGSGVMDRACVERLVKADWLTDPAYKLVAEACRGSVLDVGCGCGIQYAAFKRYLGEIEYTGVDIDKPILSFCEKIFPEARWGWADARSLPFEDGSFDTVLFRHVLEHHPPEQMVQIVSEALRVARERVVILFFKIPGDMPILRKTKGGLYVNRYSQVQIFKALDAAGGDLERRKIRRTKKSCALSNQELWTQDIR